MSFQKILVTFVRLIILSNLKSQNVIRFHFYGIQAVFFQEKNSKLSHKQVTNNFFSVTMSYSSSITNLSSSCASFIKSGFALLLVFKTSLSLSNLGVLLIKGGFFFLLGFTTSIGLTLFGRFTYQRCFPLFLCQ